MVLIKSKTNSCARFEDAPYRLLLYLLVESQNVSQL
jgi:hypothetical protein